MNKKILKLKNDKDQIDTVNLIRDIVIYRDL